MKIAHYIVTALVMAVVVWLLIAELKRMKTNKELAQSVPAVESTEETA